MPRDRDRAFFGHPIGLSTLFFTEMWERLSYYGMRAFLILYMVAPLAKGGREMSDASAGLVMALYTSAVYLLSLPGGWIADRFLGQRRAVTIGGIGIMIGNGLLALPVDAGFYPGLCMIALGTGLLKPNISTIVGQLYKPEDARRDAGFTIYYMGINLGALVAPFLCGYLAQSDGFRSILEGQGIDPNLCWKFAFAAPAVGMALGLVQYLIGYKRMGDSGLHPTIPTDPAKAKRDKNVLGGIIGGLGGVVLLVYLVRNTLDADTIGNIFGVGLALTAIALFYGMLKTAQNHDERKRILAMIPLFIGAIGFFGVFEQASSTLSLFAERLVDREWFGLTVPASYWQGANSTFVLLLAPVFAALWIALIRRNKEPSSVNKFGIGMVFTAISFVVLLPSVPDVSQRTELLTLFDHIPYVGDLASETTDWRVSPNYLVILYFFATCAELCISPVGLSSMSKLAPTRMAGMVMGTWFLATSIGNYLAGRAAGFSASRGYAFLFYTLIISSLVIAAALFFIAPRIRRMMTDSKASGPPDKTEKTEPEPLPKAKATDKKSD